MQEAPRYGWEKENEAFSTLWRTAPSFWILLCQILGAVFCFAFLASFVLACAPWVSLASPKCSLLYPPLIGGTFFPAEEQQGWHIQATLFFTWLCFWLFLTSYFLQ